MAYQAVKRLAPVEVPMGFVASYKNAQALKIFLTGKGKIIGRSRTLFSEREQKLLTREIKRARHLGLLPYVTVVK